MVAPLALPALLLLLHEGAVCPPAVGSEESKDVSAGGLGAGEGDAGGALLASSSAFEVAEAEGLV